MKRFDESRHPRGGDPSNPGRFSRKEYAEVDVSLGQDHEALPPGLSPHLLEVLESAADLQEMVPDTVLVGGTVSSLYAGHRTSYDHDHVLMDLKDRYESILEALEEEGDWVTNRVVSGKIILGQLGEIEAGVRQLIRKKPLEVSKFTMPSGKTLTVPTIKEALRVKAFLIVKRNQLRDYLDVAAMSSRYGAEFTAETLLGIDRYYTDPALKGTPVADQLIRQLGDAKPKDSRTKTQLAQYKELDSYWQNWDNTKAALADV